MDNKISKVKRMKECLEVEIKEKIARFELETETEVDNVLVYKDYKDNVKKVKITVKI